MKILIVKTVSKGLDKKITYNVQGIGLGTEFVRLGHQVALVYFAEDGKDRTQTIAVDDKELLIYHISGKEFLKSALYNHKLYELCEEYDIIQASEYDQYTTWNIYKHFPQKTIIYHGPYNSEYTKKHNYYVRVFDIFFLNRKHYKDAHVITKSKLAERYLRNKGFRNVKTLGVGFNPEYIDINCEESSIPIVVKNLKNAKNNSKYLLYVGAISERKNVKFLLEIVHALKEKNEKVVLLIVGKINIENQYYKECVKYIDNKKLKSNVIFCGQIEQKYLKHFYQMADVFLLSTQYDIYGMVYLEAMYFGVPVVTTLCGGSSTLMEDGKSGYIRKIGDISGWCEAIEKILTDTAAKDKMAEEEQKIIKEKYLWSKLVYEFEKEYRKLL